MRVAEQSITCREVVEQATEMFEGTLNESHTHAIEQHLAVCSDCGEMYSQLEMTIGLADSSAVEPLSPLLRQRLFALPRSGVMTGESGKETSESDGCPVVDDKVAAAYLDDRLGDVEQIAVIEHLIDGCGECAQRCRRLAFPELGETKVVMRDLREEVPGPEFDSVWRGLYETADHESWATKVQGMGWKPRDFLLWMIRFARSFAFDNGMKYEEVALAAFEFAQDLGREERARAAMLRGQVARRVGSDFLEADRWFDTAEQSLPSGRSHDLLRAKLLRMRGMARYCQSRNSEATDLLNQASELYLTCGEIARFGECQLDLAAVASESDSPKTAVKMALSATALLRWDGYPRHALAVGQNLAIYCASAGRPERALSYLQLAREYLPSGGSGAVDVAQLDWTQGRILSSSGNHVEAARVLDETRRRFMELELAGNAAWVALDLSVPLIKLGRVNALEEVSGAMLGYFFSRTLPREALAAVRLYRDAVASRSLTTMQVRSFIASLSTRSDMER